MSLRLALFGGTFDPIHFGHLRLAEDAREQLRLDRVLFIPNRISPLKTDERPTDPVDRLDMVRLAIADHPAFSVDAREIERDGPSYTIDTVRALRREHPDAELFFVTGTDAVRDLRLWKDADHLVREVRIVVAARPGTEHADVAAVLPPEWAARLTFIAMPPMDISASNLRSRVSAGRSIRYLTPPAVEEHIRRRGLYSNNPEEENL